MKVTAVLVKRLRRFALFRDPRGASAVEFGLIAAPFLALLVAIIETSLLFFSQQTLETAAQAAARQVLTNKVTGKMSQSQFKDYACSKLPGFLKCSNLLVDVRRVSSFASADMSPPTVTMSGGQPTANTKFEPGAPTELILVRLLYVWNVQGAPLGFTLANMGANQRLLISTSLARTEPL